MKIMKWLPSICLDSDHGVKAQGDGWLLTVALGQLSSISSKWQIPMWCSAVMAELELVQSSFKLSIHSGMVGPFGTCLAFPH